MSEEKQWIKAPIKSGRWVPQAEGDELVGVYLESEKGSFRGKPNCKYMFKTDNPSANSDGVAFVYGTDAINEGMKDIPKGYMVKITYHGEKPTPDPKKKAYKVFEVCAFIDKDDPLYQKWYPDEGGEASPGPEMNIKDYPEANNLIMNYTEIYQADHHGQNPAAEDLIQMAETDPDVDDTMKSHVKAAVANQVKNGKIKEKGGVEGG
jgi:hypothetical protein